MILQMISLILVLVSLGGLMQSHGLSLSWKKVNLMGISALTLCIVIGTLALDNLIVGKWVSSIVLMGTAFVIFGYHLFLVFTMGYELQIEEYASVLDPADK